MLLDNVPQLTDALFLFFFSLLVSTWTISLALSSRLLIFSLSDLLSSHSVYFSLNFFFLFLATLGLCCCVGLFSSCSKQWLLFTWSVWASHCGGVTRCAAWALGLGGLSSCSSQAREHRLNGCEADLLASAFGISLGQGLNEPASPLSASGFFTTEAPPKPHGIFLNRHFHF